MHTQLVLTESWLCGAGAVGQHGCDGDFAMGDPAQIPAGFERRNTTLRRASAIFVVEFLSISLSEL
jgi:hypothetical protein